jgi:hypothetical protein
MTLLGVVDNLNHRIESLDSSSSNDQEGIEERGSGDTGNPEVDGLSNQLAEIENVDYTLEKTLTSMKIDLERIQAGWRGTLVRVPNIHSPYYILNLSSSAYSTHPCCLLLEP